MITPTIRRKNPLIRIVLTNDWDWISYFIPSKHYQILNSWPHEHKAITLPIRHPVIRCIESCFNVHDSLKTILMGFLWSLLNMVITLKKRVDRLWNKRKRFHYYSFLVKFHRYSYIYNFIENNLDNKLLRTT